MKIDKCARCGSRMSAALPSCEMCGWVPIGAGLKASGPKAPRRRLIDPSRGGFYVMLVAFGIGVFALHQARATDWVVGRAMETGKSLQTVQSLAAPGKRSEAEKKRAAQGALAQSGLSRQMKKVASLTEDEQP